jgi:cytochrome P450
MILIMLSSDIYAAFEQFAERRKETQKNVFPTHQACNCLPSPHWLTRIRLAFDTKILALSGRNASVLRAGAVLGVIDTPPVRASLAESHIASTSFSFQCTFDNLYSRRVPTAIRKYRFRLGQESLLTMALPIAAMPPTLQMLGLAAGTSLILERLAPQASLGIFTTSTILFFLQFVIYETYIIILYPRFLSPLRDLPTPSDNHFFTGQTKRIMREVSGMPMRDWVENVPNDGLIRYSVWFQERVLVTDAKTLGEVLVTKNYEFIKPSHFRNGLGRILGIGILLAEGDEHKRQRKNLMPAFAYRHIKDLYPVFWGKSREMVECVSEAMKSHSKTPAPSTSANDPEKAEPAHQPTSIEVGNWTSRATLDIIGVSGVGQDFNSLRDPDNKLNQTYRNVFNPGRTGRVLQLLGIFLPFWFLSRLPVKRNQEIIAANRYIKQLCRDLIAQKRKAMAEKERTDVDIVSVALESGGFTDEDLVNQMMTFLVAGHETTATAMIWAIYLLCKHPDVQSKLRDEVRSKLPSLDQDVTAAQVDDCHYLHAVCSEVLRLWSPVSLTMRVAEKDSTLNGHFIPKGTTVILAPWAVNTSTHLWGPDATEFKPERWLDADGKANNKGGAASNYAFLTFLHGPRSCIGQKFAQAEFACLLAAWVGRFDTMFEEGSELARPEMPEIKGGITAKPKGGLWVDLKEVEGW